MIFFIYQNGQIGDFWHVHEDPILVEIIEKGNQA
jgi:hypothetical protein